MVLKEAFRMQNHLANLSEEAIIFLSQNENVMKIKEEHQRSRRNPKAVDETVEKKRDHDMTANNVVDLLLDLMNEREKLSLAISRAKTAAAFDIDAAIAANKARQEAVSCLKEMAAKKSSDTETRGTDYLINAEGNQTVYYYIVRTIQTIDFDRDTVRGIAKRLQRESDAVSTKIDQLNVMLEVEYEPKYDFDSSFEDAYGSFIETK